jgi:hypothetical protein
MMMVDTINPNTNEPDSFGGTSPQNPQGSGTNLGDGRFFSGFDQPDNVKVNLATPTPGEQPTGTMDSLSNGPVLRPAEPAPNNQPVEQHSTYARSGSNGVNWRGVFVIAFLGVFLSGVISGITWFAISSSSKKALDTTSSELAKLESQLASLNETPEPLELPSEVVETPVNPTPETPVTPETPAPTETETTPTPPQVETQPRQEIKDGGNTETPSVVGNA